MVSMLLFSKSPWMLGAYGKRSSVFEKKAKGWKSGSKTAFLSVFHPDAKFLIIQ
jgi:hypothetical protein